MIGSIADKLACAGTSGANTGKLGCLSLFGTPTNLLAVTRGTVIDPTVNFTIDWIREQVQKGIMIPLIDASTFEDVSAEDGYSTNSRGRKRLNLKGLPEYRLTFEEGHEFYRELARLESFKQYDYIIGDDEGNWMIAKRYNSSFQGFTAGHTTPELTTRAIPGGDPESKSILIQFLDRLQFDENYAILHASELEFMPSEIPCVNGVNIAYVEEPAAAGTSIVFSVKLSSDNNTVISGLTEQDIRILVNDEPVAITSVTEGADMNYTATVPALVAGDKIVTETYDATLNAHVIDSNDVLYRSRGVEAVVLA